MLLMDEYLQARRRLLDYFGAEQTGYYSEVIDMTETPWLTLQKNGMLYIIYRSPSDLFAVPRSRTLCTATVKYELQKPEWLELLEEYRSDNENPKLAAFIRSNKASKLKTYACWGYTMFHVIRSKRKEQLESFIVFDNDLICANLEELIQAVLRGDKDIDLYSRIHS